MSLPQDVFGRFDFRESTVTFGGGAFVPLVTADANRVVLIVSAQGAILSLTISTAESNTVGNGIPVGPETHLTSVLHAVMPALAWFVGAAAGGTVTVFEVFLRREQSQFKDEGTSNARE